MGKNYTFKKALKNPEILSIISLSYALRYPEKKVFEELDKEGFTISRSTLYKVKNQLRQNLINDINEAQAFGVVEEYFAAIKAIKEGQRRLWDLSHEETDPYKQAEIITQAINTYPFLTGYYNNLSKVMAKHKSFKVQPDITV